MSSINEIKADLAEQINSRNRLIEERERELSAMQAERDRLLSALSALSGGDYPGGAAHLKWSIEDLSVLDKIVSRFRMRGESSLTHVCRALAESGHPMDINELETVLEGQFKYNTLYAAVKHNADGTPAAVQWTDTGAVALTRDFVSAAGGNYDARSDELGLAKFSESSRGQGEEVP